MGLCGCFFQGQNRCHTAVASIKQVDPIAPVLTGKSGRQGCGTIRLIISGAGPKSGIFGKVQSLQQNLAEGGFNGTHRQGFPIGADIGPVIMPTTIQHIAPRLDIMQPHRRQGR